MKIINIKDFNKHSYRSAWQRAKNFSDKLNAYFLDIRCAECEVDQFLASGLAQLFDIQHKIIVMYLEGYNEKSCDKSVKKFIEQYLKTFNFSNTIYVIAQSIN